MKLLYLIVSTLCTLLLPHLSQVKAQSSDDSPSVIRFCRHGIESVAWSPDSQQIAVQGYEGVRLFDAAFGHIASLVVEEYLDTTMWVGEPPSDDIRCWGKGVAWSADGNQVVFPFYYEDFAPEGMWLNVWNVSPVQSAASIPPSHSLTTISDIAWKPNGKEIAMAYLASNSGNWGVYVASAETQQLFTEFGYSDSPITSLSWHSTDDRLAVAKADGSIQFWEVTEESFGSETPPSQFKLDVAVNDVAWSPDGEMLASAGADGKILVWNVEIGEVIQTLVGHQGEVLALDWNASGSAIASGSTDSTIRIWNIETGETVRILEGHTDKVHTLDWSPDDHMIVSASYDNTVRIWDSSQ